MNSEFLKLSLKKLKNWVMQSALEKDSARGIHCLPLLTCPSVLKKILIYSRLTACDLNLAWYRQVTAVGFWFIWHPKYQFSRVQTYPEIYHPVSFYFVISFQYFKSITAQKGIPCRYRSAHTEMMKCTTLTRWCHLSRKY